MATRHVLVTGGAHRLGAELVRAFAAAGWAVWCHHHRSAEAASALAADLNRSGARVHTVQADLAQPEAVDHMVDRIEAEAGALDCVVNNASLFEPDPNGGFAPASLAAQMPVNLVAPLHLAERLSRPQRPPGTDRCAIHVLDQKVFNLNPDYFSYTLTKLTLERAVALQAQALAPSVRVCGVAPGLMYLSGPQQPENFAEACRVNLRRTPVDPADVAQACVFLAQTRSITGATLAVDNGQHLVPLERDVMFLPQERLQRHTRTGPSE